MERFGDVKALGSQFQDALPSNDRQSPVPRSQSLRHQILELGYLRLVASLRRCRSGSANLESWREFLRRRDRRRRRGWKHPLLQVRVIDGQICGSLRGRVGADADVVQDEGGIRPASNACQEAHEIGHLTSSVQDEFLYRI